MPETEERKLLCLDRTSGKILWQQTVVKSPLERKHGLNSHASSTPATDGKLVYVAFLDVNQMAIAAYDFSGKQKWLVRPERARLLQFADFVQRQSHHEWRSRRRVLHRRA